MIQFIIQDTQILLDHVPEEERDEIMADEDQVVQGAEAGEVIEPTEERGEVEGILEAAGAPLDFSEVLQAAGVPFVAGEIREGDQDVAPRTQEALQESPANQVEEENEDEENDNFETMEETVRTALSGFQNAASELQTTTAALVRGRRRRAERLLGQLARGGGGRGRGAGRGRGRGRGRGGRRRGRGANQHAANNGSEDETDDE